MKTVEEAAEKYGKNYGNDSGVAKLAFKAGVEFAQRWISVNYELPDDGQRFIGRLNDTCYEANTYYESGVVDTDYMRLYFTHWRPIEIK
jgi:hypothetical protein